MKTKAAFRVLVPSVILAFHPCTASPAIDSIQGDWLPLAGGIPGMDNSVTKLKWKDHDLWAIGSFTQAGTSKALGIARYRKGEGWALPGSATWKVPELLGTDELKIADFGFAPDGKIWEVGNMGSGWWAPLQIRSFDGVKWNDESNGLQCAYEASFTGCSVQSISFDANSNPVVHGYFSISKTDSARVRTARRVDGIWQQVALPTGCKPGSAQRWGRDSLVCAADHGVWIGTWDAMKPLGMDSATADSIHPATVFRAKDGSVLAVEKDSLSFRALGIKSPIAKWDGTAWIPFGAPTATGSATRFVPNALAQDTDGQILATGRFPVKDLADRSRLLEWRGDRWDTIAWSKEPLGFAPEIFADIAVDTDGRIALGGTFRGLVGLVAMNFALREDGVWRTVDSGFDGKVHAMTFDHSGALVVGGSFTSVGGETVNHVARWDGEKWHALGSGFDDAVTALAPLPDGGIVAGGSFLIAGKELVNHLAKWDGTTWSGIGAGMKQSVAAVAVDSQGGIWSGPGERADLQRWNGSTWIDASSYSSNISAPHAITVAPNGAVRALYSTGSSSSTGILSGSLDKLATSSYLTSQYTSFVEMRDAKPLTDSVFAYAGRFNLDKWPLAIQRGSRYTYPDIPFKGIGSALAVGQDGAVFLGGDLVHGGGRFSAMRWKDSLATRIVGLQGEPAEMGFDPRSPRLVVVGDVCDGSGSSVFALRNPQASPVRPRQDPTTREALRRIGRDLVASKDGHLEILRPDGRMEWTGLVPAGFSTERLALSPGLHIARMDATTLRFLVPVR